MTRRSAFLQFLLPVLLLACQAPQAGTEDQITREAINPQLPARPYSQAMRVGNTFYFSGKLGVTEETLAMTEGRIEAETRNIMESFRGLFQEVGVGFEDVVQGTVYLADVGYYNGMNQVYGEYFPENPPARECTPPPVYHSCRSARLVATLSKVTMWSRNCTLWPRRSMTSSAKTTISLPFSAVASSSNKSS